LRCILQLNQTAHGMRVGCWKMQTGMLRLTRRFAAYKLLASRDPFGEVAQLLDIDRPLASEPWMRDLEQAGAKRSRPHIEAKPAQYFPCLAFTEHAI